jgi:hypothetical protein
MSGSGASFASPFHIQGKTRVLFIRTSDIGSRNIFEYFHSLCAPRRDIVTVLRTAQEVKETERRQAEAIDRGQTLHEQFHFEAYLAKRQHDPAWSFRNHLRDLGGAIEE